MLENTNYFNQLFVFFAIFVLNRGKIGLISMAVLAPLISWPFAIFLP